MLLWVGQAISDLGSAVTLLALPLLAVTVLDASALQVGLLAAAATVGWLTVSLQQPLCVLAAHLPRPASPATTDLVLGIGSIGGVVGGALADPLSRRIGSARLLWLGKLSLGAFTLLIPLAGRRWGVFMVSAGMFADRAATVLYNVLQITYRQSVCPPDLLGRMNASVRWIIRGGMPLGGLLARLLGTWIGVRGALAIAVAGSWLAVLCIVCSPLRRLRDIPIEEGYGNRPERSASRVSV